MATERKTAQEKVNFIHITINKKLRDIHISYVKYSLKSYVDRNYMYCLKRYTVFYCG